MACRTGVLRLLFLPPVAFQKVASDRLVRGSSDLLVVVWAQPHSVHPRSSLFGWHCVLSKIFSCRKAVHLWWRNRGGTWKEAADECPIQPVEWKCQRKYQGLVLVVPPLHCLYCLLLNHVACQAPCYYLLLLQHQIRYWWWMKRSYRKWDKRKRRMSRTSSRGQ